MAVDVSKIPNNNKFDPVREAILQLQTDIEDTGNTIGNGTLTIGTSGTLSGSATFTANQSSNTTITIGIDDSDYVSLSETSLQTLSGSLSLVNITLSGYLRGPSTFVIDPATHGDDTGTLVIAGNLQVDGTTTTINSTTLTIDDKNIVLASGAANASAADGAGITIDGASATLTYVSASDRFRFNKDVEANLIGNASTATTANSAGSADTLTTARNIAVDGAVTGNADFDGSGDITITTTVNHNHDDRYYTETESDNRFVNVDGDTMTGSLTIDDSLTITGTTNNLVIDETADGTWELYDSFQNNGIIIHSSTSGIELQYNGVTEMTIDGGGVTFNGTIDLSDANLNIGSADIVFGIDDTDTGARGLVWNFDADGNGTASNIGYIRSGGTLVGEKLQFNINVEGTITGSDSIYEFKNAGTDVVTIGANGSVTATTFIGNLTGTASNADAIDNIDSSRIIFGSNSSGTNEGTVTDWNSPTKTGFYSDDNADNRWSGQANWTSILHFKLYDNNNDYASQIGFNTYDDGLYTRTNNNGTWSSWKKIWTEYSDSALTLQYITDKGNSTNNDIIFANNDATRLIRSNVNGGAIALVGNGDDTTNPDRGLFLGGVDNSAVFTTAAQIVNNNNFDLLRGDYKISGTTVIDSGREATFVNVSVDAGGSNGVRIHTNSGITASNNYLNFFTAQSSGWSFNANGTGADTDSVLTIDSSGNVNADGDIIAIGGVKAKHFSTDGTGKSYTWRPVNNTGNNSGYYKIARITSTQSARFIIELAGRSTSYSDPLLPAMGYIVGQLNNDNNYDIVFYNHANSESEVVSDVGQVDVSETATDIYVQLNVFAELVANASISDGNITTYSTSSAETLPTGYTSANQEYKVWNSGNDGELTLDYITDNGATTTNGISVGDLSASNVTVNQNILTPSNANLYLRPNGTGDIYFGVSGNGNTIYHYSKNDDGVYTIFDHTATQTRFDTTGTAGFRFEKSIRVDDKITIGGTTNDLLIDETADGTWHIYDTFQDNGIKIYSSTGGMEFQYNGVTEMTINGSGVVFNGTVDLSDANLNIGSADIVFGIDSTDTGARGLVWNFDADGNGSASNIGYIRAGGTLVGETMQFNMNAEGTNTGTDKIYQWFNSGEEVLSVTANGKIYFDGTATTTNQDRGLYWTAYDKESVADFTDFASIIHTTNDGGLTGSVIQIKSMNDANDGVNFHTNNNDGVRINGNIILNGGNYTSVLDPRYVNVTGDTMTGTLTVNQNINSVSGNPLVLTGDGGANIELYSDFAVFDADSLYIRTQAASTRFAFDSAAGLFTIYNQGNTGGLDLRNSNSRIYFQGYRAIEGATDGSNLYIGEGYTNIIVPASKRFIVGNSGNSYDSMYVSYYNQNTLNTAYGKDADDADLWVNYRGYNDGQTRYRNFVVGDGRGGVMARFTGQDDAFNLYSKQIVHRSEVWSETTQGLATGSIHLDPASTTDHAGGSITWGASDAANGTNAQAGIYVRSDGTYGTKMYFSTTDSYAVGSKTAMSIDHTGLVTVNPDQRNISGGAFKVAYDMRLYNTLSFTDASWNMQGYIQPYGGNGVRLGGGSGSVAWDFNASNGYLYLPSWLKLGASGAGIFSDTNGAHFYPSNYSYGTWRINGTSDGGASGFTGIAFDNTTTPTLMYDTNGGGVYAQGSGNWQFYYANSTGCLAIGGTSTTSGYKAQINGSLRVDSGIYSVEGISSGRGYGSPSPNLNSGSAVWSKIGTFYTSQGGRNLKLEINCGQGYNASVNQHHIAHIIFRTSNGASNSGGFYGSCHWYKEGYIDAITAIKVKQISTSEFEFYAFINNFYGYSFAKAEHSGSDSFVFDSSYNTGEPTGTIFTAVEKFALRSGIQTSSGIYAGDSLEVQGSAGIGTAPVSGYKMSINAGGLYPLKIDTSQRYAIGFQNSSISESGYYPWLAHQYSTQLDQGNASQMVIHFNGIGDKFYFNRHGAFYATGNVSTDEWFRINGGQGLYFQSYTRGLWSPDAQGSTGTYGNVCTYGPGRSDWRGWTIGEYNVSFMENGDGGGLYDAANGRWRFYYSDNNNGAGIGSSVTSGTYKLRVNGSIYATNDVVAYSDRRVKENIVNIDSALDKVKALQGVYYNRINDKDKVREIGFIAQDVHDAVPELASYAEDIDEWGVKYSQVTGLHNEAIKELASQIEQKDEQIANLQSQIDELKQLILNK